MTARIHRTPTQRLKRRLYHILETPISRDPLDILVNGIIAAAIFLGVVLVFLEGSQISILDKHQQFTLELLATIFFTIEFATRLWVCNAHHPHAHPVWSRLRYMLGFFALVDVACLVPMYVNLFVEQPLFYISAVRLLRFLRLMRLTPYGKSVLLIQKVFWAQRKELVVSFFALLILVLISSSMMFYAEHNAQPKVFSSIVATFWWCVVTVTSVGYGDAVPITVMGKIIAAITALIGVALYALPTSILVAGFMHHLNRKDQHHRQQAAHHKEDAL
jgi:voltage-gated potassium channel